MSTQNLSIAAHATIAARAAARLPVLELTVLLLLAIASLACALIFPDLMAGAEPPAF